MPKKETPPEIRYFIAGLKKIIRTSWPTQEEFSRGVTSEVNMSNILRGNTGTSATMRQALAQKAGMSIEEVIELGKASLNGEPILNKNIVTPAIMNNNQDEESYFYGGSITDILNNIADLSVEMHNNLSNYTKSMTSMTRNLIEERDKLVKLLAQEQAIFNALPGLIKIVNRDMQVVSVNRAMLEKYQVTPGDTCYQDNCALCGGVHDNCIVKQVFQRGKPIRRILHGEQNKWCIMSAFPITDPTWQVEKVVIYYTLGEQLEKLFTDNGWIAPVPMNITNSHNG